MSGRGHSKSVGANPDCEDWAAPEEKSGFEGDGGTWKSDGKKSG
jgi:hypothetical protein